MLRWLTNIYITLTQKHTDDGATRKSQKNLGNYVLGIIKYP